MTSAAGFDIDNNTLSRADRRTWSWRAPLRLESSSTSARSVRSHCGGGLHVRSPIRRQVLFLAVAANSVRSAALCFFAASEPVRGAFFFFFQAEDGIRDLIVTGVQTCALPI